VTVHIGSNPEICWDVKTHTVQECSRSAVLLVYLFIFSQFVLWLGVQRTAHCTCGVQAIFVSWWWWPRHGRRTNRLRMAQTWTTYEQT